MTRSVLPFENTTAVCRAALQSWGPKQPDKEPAFVVREHFRKTSLIHRSQISAIKKEFNLENRNDTFIETMLFSGCTPCLRAALAPHNIFLSFAPTTQHSLSAERASPAKSPALLIYRRGSAGGSCHFLDISANIAPLQSILLHGGPP